MQEAELPAVTGSSCRSHTVYYFRTMVICRERYSNVTALQNGDKISPRICTADLLMRLGKT